MKKIFYFVALAAMVASCSKDPMVEPAVNSESDMVNVSVDVAMVGTRIGIDTSASSWKLGWEEDDTLSAVDNNGNVTEFTISTYGAESSTFSGSVNGLAETFKLIYPYEAVSTDATGNYYPIDLREQDGTMDGSTYMISDSAIEVANTATPAMRHIGSYIKLNMKGGSGISGTIDGVNISGDVYVTSVELCDVAAQGQVKLDEAYDSPYLLATTNGNIMATASGTNGFGEDVGNNSKTQTIYLNVLPFEVEAGGSLSFNVTLKDNATIFYGTITTTTTNAFSFERGEYHEVSITLDAGSFKQASSMSVNIASTATGSSSSTDSDSYTVSGTAYDIPNVGDLAAAMTAAGFSQTETNNKLIITGKMNYADFETLRTYPIKEIDMSGVTLEGYFHAKVPIDLTSKTDTRSSSVMLNVIPYAAFSNIDMGTDATIIDNTLSSVLEKITLPSALSQTGYASFKENSQTIADRTTALKTVVIPSSVTNLQYQSFMYCSNLTSVIIGTDSGLTTTGVSVFEGSSLTSFQIPSKMTNVGEKMFNSVKTLKQVTFAKDNTVMATINKQAFSGCTSLTSLSIPATVKTINSKAFDSSSLEEVTMLGDVPATSTDTSAFPSTFLSGSESSVIYVQDTYYDNYVADNYWSTLNISSIASDASIITINNETAGGLATLVAAAQTTQSNATKIVVTGKINYYDLEALDGFAVVDLSGVTTFYSEATADATETTTKFPAGYFANNTTLTSMTLPSGKIAEIEASAFSGCTNLEYFSWTKPSSGNVILNSSVFASCAKLNNSTVNHILSGVNLLKGNQIFTGNTSLTAVVLDGNITTMWNKLFTGCTNLISITFTGTNSANDGSDSTFFPDQFATGYSGTQGTVYVPNNTEGSYASWASNGWNVVVSE